MIEERHEELAALYALDLLEGRERSSFETSLAADDALTALVRELRDAGATLAYTAPAAVPPAALRTRVLASVSAAKSSHPPAKLLSFFSVFPWAVAAALTLSAAWLGQLYLAAQAEARLLRDTTSLAEISLKGTQQQLEAERILTRRRLLDSEQQTADALRLLSSARTQLAERDTDLSTLNERVAALGSRLQRETDLAHLRITALASLLKNSPQALAVAVWHSDRQEGLLQVEKLPALATGQDYQLWVVDPQYPSPVDGGVFTVDPQTGEARIPFRSKLPIKNIAAYAITQEVKGGVAQSAGPFLLLGQ
jgi:anti-sigma-K factor RskA